MQEVYPEAVAARQGMQRRRTYSSPKTPKMAPSPKPPRRSSTDESSAFLAVIYGAVNAVMCIPVLYGYAAIIFGAPVYQGVMPALAKAVLFSSVIHQLSFSLLSSLPFAIGQVQDAGLLFLCKITEHIADRLSNEPDEVVISTALAATSIGTALLGVCLCAIGRARLARLVSYLPMPVIGAYLAFIGFFCLEAGLGICTGEVIDGLDTWPALFHVRPALLCLPGVVCGVLLWYVSRHFQHFAALPAAIVAVPLLFYAGLGVSGRNLQDARDAGLVGQTREPADWTEVFALYRFDLVQWSALLYELPVWAGMVIVVAFSSSLDVAAIEMDMGRPLDTNSELITVGVGNILSGLTGGFTGSYIFSQTIFTYRTKCRSRNVGWIVLFSELAVFFVRADPLMYFPLYFFAATLVFIAVDLMVEWLVEVRRKLRVDEYLVLLGTFVAIQVLDINLGLLFGIGLSVLSFAVSYASDPHWQLVEKRSRRLRPTTQRAMLLQYQDKIVCMELSGEVFFGTSLAILEQVRMLLGVSAADSVRRDSASKTPAARLTESMSWLWSRMKRRGRAKKRGRDQERADRAERELSDEEAARLPIMSDQPVYPLTEDERDNGAAEFTVSADGECADVVPPLVQLSVEAPRHYGSVSDARADVSQPSRVASARAGEGGFNYSSGVGNGAANYAFNVDDAVSPVSRSCEGAATAAESTARGGNAPAGSISSSNSSSSKARVKGILRRGLSPDSMAREQWESQQRRARGGSYGSTPDRDRGREGVRRQRSGSGLSSSGTATPGASMGERERSLTITQMPGNLNDEGIPSFIVLDCARVTKMDATSARSCFLPLQRLTESHAICVAFAALPPPVAALLRAHGCLEGERVQQFPSAHTALDWCESTLIRAATAPNEGFRMLGLFGKRHSFRPAKLSMQAMLRDVLELADDEAEALERLDDYTHDHNFAAGETIFAPGGPSDCFYVLLHGEVTLSSAASYAQAQEQRERSVSTMDTANRSSRAGIDVTLHPGDMFGHVDFALEGPRTFCATAISECTVCVFSRDALDALQEDEPRLLCLLLRSVCKHSAIDAISQHMY